MAGNEEKLIAELLKSIGEDPKREGLRKTPERFLKTWTKINSGYGMKLEEVVNDALYEAEDSNMVIVKDIDFYSTCEHHLLPFFGKVHVGYIPDKKIIGISKIPRIVDIYARRLQVQERLCGQVASAINKVLKPKGVAVVMEAAHACMVVRGVQKANSSTMTSTMLGSFRSRPETRQEFLSLIK